MLPLRDVVVGVVTEGVVLATEGVGVVEGVEVVGGAEVVGGGVVGASVAVIKLHINLPTNSIIVTGKLIADPMKLNTTN